jgi:hypothetical protein
MSEQIYIPKNLKVGYQKRGDTYSGKLGFVTYLDDKNVHRQEKSFNGWIEKKMGVDDFENKPMEGFVLNRNVGGVYDSYTSDIRIEKVRVYDPRGFEFEIDIPNVLRILQECTSTKGKGLEGEFVYGWIGKKLVLVPVGSHEYTKAVETTKLQSMGVSMKDLVPGMVYLTKKNEQILYLGRFDWYPQDDNNKRDTKSKFFPDEKYYVTVKNIESKKQHIFAVKADEEHRRMYGDFTLADFDDDEKEYLAEVKNFQKELDEIIKTKPYDFKPMASTSSLAKAIGEVDNYAEILEWFNKNKHSSKFVSVEIKPFKNKLVVKKKYSWYEINHPQNLCKIPEKKDAIDLINIGVHDSVRYDDKGNKVDTTTIKSVIKPNRRVKYDDSNFEYMSLYGGDRIYQLNEINTADFGLAYAKLENGALIPLNEFLY